MIRTGSPRVRALLSRSALGLALALGSVAAGTLPAAPAMAAPKKAKEPKLNFSSGFRSAAGPVDEKLAALDKRADVAAAKQKVESATNALRAAQGKAAVDAAVASRNGAIAELQALLAPEKQGIESAFAAVSNEDDRFYAGQMAISFGAVSQDPALQRRGIEAQVQSGKLSAADLPLRQYFLGSIAMDMRDYAVARTALQAAVDAGIDKEKPDAVTQLVQAYTRDNQTQQGLEVLKRVIAARQTAGTAIPATWYGVGLDTAYRAKLVVPSAEFGAMLVQSDPNPRNWVDSLGVIRQIGGYTNAELIDLMRLMRRTNALEDRADYLEYVRIADARGLPGEVISVIQEGASSGKLPASDATAKEYKETAESKVALDRKTLPANEAAAKKPTGTGQEAIDAGDAYLNYGNYAKAEELYTVASGKTGVDAELAALRLGIAQAEQSKFAEAQASFAKVNGKRKPLGLLWGAYAAQKARGGAAPAAVAGS